MAEQLISDHTTAQSTPRSSWEKATEIGASSISGAAGGALVGAAFGGLVGGAIGAVAGFTVNAAISGAFSPAPQGQDGPPR